MEKLHERGKDKGKKKRRRKKDEKKENHLRMSYTTNVVSNVTKIKDKIVASFCVVTVLCVFVLLMWCFVRANNARGQALGAKL